MNYPQQLKSLHEARLELERAKKVKSELMSAFLTSIKYVDAVDAEETYADIVDSLEQSIKDAALLDDSKHPHPAVTVKDFTVLEYEEVEAVDYCRFHAPVALDVKLNKAVFKKIVEASKPDFVTVKIEKRAQIASDLSKFVGEE